MKINSMTSDIEGSSEELFQMEDEFVVFSKALFHHRVPWKN